MNKIISRGLWGVLCVGGLSVLGATAAHAAETTGDDGTAAGTQALISVDLPINIGDNAIGILGESEQSGGSAAQPAAQPSVDVAPPSTSGIDSLLGGTQAVLDVAVPITVSGNAIGVAGDTSVENTDAVTAAPTEAPTAGSPAMTDGNDGIASGTQVLPDVTAPITIDGNAIGLLGDSSVEGHAGDATTDPGSSDNGTTPAITDGSDSVLGGTQVAPVATAPITVGGNAVGLLGDSSVEGNTAGAASDGVTTDGGMTDGNDGGTTDGGMTDGSDGVLSGTQIVPVVTLPIDLGGNAIGIIGDSTVVEEAGSEPGTEPGSGPGTDEPGTESGDSTTPGTTAPGITAPGITAPGTTTPHTGIAGDGGAVMATAAMGPTALAVTGAPSAPAAVISLLLVVAGLALAALTRMRARAA